MRILIEKGGFRRFGVMKSVFWACVETLGLSLLISNQYTARGMVSLFALCCCLIASLSIELSYLYSQLGPILITLSERPLAPYLFYIRTKDHIPKLCTETFSPFFHIRDYKSTYLFQPDRYK